MAEHIDKLPAITNLSKKEKKILNDKCVKLHIKRARLPSYTQIYG